MVVAAAMLVPFSPEMPTPGLDPSWRIALNQAIEHGLVFGKDIVFTFGPLGSVYTQVYSPATDAIMMWASAFYALAFAAIFGLAAYPRKKLLALALPVIVALSLSRDPFFASMPLLLLLGVVRVSVPKGSPLHLHATWWVKATLMIATIGIGMTPIIKGSFGGVVFPVAVLSAIVLWQKDFRVACAFGALFILSLAGWWIFAGQPIAQLPLFFIAQSPIVSGYTEAMSLNGPWTSPVLFILAAIALCYVAWQAVRREARIPGYALFLGVAWTLFVSFKTGLVRQDGHAFISAGMLLFIAFAVVSITKRSKGLFVAFVSIFAAATIARAALPIDWSYPAQRFETVASALVNGLRTRLSNDSALVQGYDASIARIREASPLPKVSGTVDVYPMDLGAIFGNGLEWSGRPVFQSYSAYTPALLKLNADHLVGKQAPQNVFFAFEPIDGRLPSLDDSSSILEILSHYRVAGYDAPYVHFVKAPSPNSVNLVASAKRSEIVSWGQEVAIHEDGPVWVDVDMRRSLFGRAAETLFKLPLMEIDLTLADGTVARHRYVPEIGRSGFIISPYMTTGMNLVNLAAGIPDAQAVKSFRLVTRFPILWKSEMTVTMTPVSIAPQHDARSFVLAAPQTSPPAGMESQAPSEAQCAIDLVNGSTFKGAPARATTASTVSIVGWIASPNDMPASDYRAWIVATSATGEKLYFEAERMPRPDVAKALNRPDQIDSGFSVTLDAGSFGVSQTLEIVAASKTSVVRCHSVLALQ